MKVVTSLCLTALLVTSCQKSSWIYFPTSNMQAFFHPKANAFSGIDVEILQDNDDLIAYLGVNREIRGTIEDPTLAPVVFIIDGHSHHFLAKKMSGNQRLYLPKDKVKLLLKAFEEEKKVVIAMQEFATEIFKPKNFHLFKLDKS